MPPDLRYTSTQLHSLVSLLNRNAGLFEDAIDIVDAYSCLLDDYSTLEKKMGLLQRKYKTKLRKRKEKISLLKHRLSQFRNDGISNSLCKEEEKEDDDETTMDEEEALQLRKESEEL